jgi:hypothetical protein
MSLLLLYPKMLGNGCYQFKSHSLLSYFPPIYQKVWTLMYPNKDSKPHARTHHVVIIINNIIIAMSTLSPSIMSHPTLIVFYHASMLTLQAP